MSQRDWPTSVGLPQAQGLYDPKNEHDNCGIGFIANIKNQKSHEIVRQGIQILVNLEYDLVKKDGGGYQSGKIGQAGKVRHHRFTCGLPATG
ncbi:MAG: hypothetical protein ACE5HI_16325 [bacterium]